MTRRIHHPPPLKLLPPSERRSESKTFDDDWLKTDTAVHLLTLFGWTVPSGIAVHSLGDKSLLGEAPHNRIHAQLYRT